MFIVQRNSLNISKSFYWWFAILTFGTLVLTMHVHYRAGKNSRPYRPAPPGFRIFGFPRPVRDLSKKTPAP
jgi:hypothetical protein